MGFWARLFGRKAADEPGGVAGALAKIQAGFGELLTLAQAEVPEHEKEKAELARIAGEIERLRADLQAVRGAADAIGLEAKALREKVASIEARLAASAPAAPLPGGESVPAAAIPSAPAMAAAGNAPATAFPAMAPPAGGGGASPAPLSPASAPPASPPAPSEERKLARTEIIATPPGTAAAAASEERPRGEKTAVHAVPDFAKEEAPDRKNPTLVIGAIGFDSGEIGARTKTQVFEAPAFEDAPPAPAAGGKPPGGLREAKTEVYSMADLAARGIDLRSAKTEAGAARCPTCGGALREEERGGKTLRICAACGAAG
jgi:hypothetical protein